MITMDHITPAATDDALEACYTGTGKSLEEKSMGETHRGLKSRHLQLIALGGSIGTGLFVGSGSVLALGGPGTILQHIYPS